MPQCTTDCRKKTELISEGKENRNETSLTNQTYGDSDATGHSVDGDRPPLRIGIVLPRQIFQRRLYQSVIWKSLNKISQMRYIGNYMHFRFDRRVLLTWPPSPTGLNRRLGRIALRGGAGGGGRVESVSSYLARDSSCFKSLLVP